MSWESVSLLMSQSKLMKQVLNQLDKQMIDHMHKAARESFAGLVVFMVLKENMKVIL